jgi:hypothetical protein
MKKFEETRAGNASSQRHGAEFFRACAKVFTARSRLPMMDILAAIEGSSFATWLRESTSLWAYPTVLTLHTLGLGVLVGANWVLDLRLLGIAPSIPLPVLVRLFRAMWIGFWVNTISGVMLFAGDATTKGATTLFVFKLGLVALGVIVLILIRRSVFGDHPEAPRVTPGARVLAATSLVIWIAAIAAGRYMAYATT